MGKRVTLKDIAAELNISRTTVHRALHGKDGISDQLRSEILARAGELGYTTNYIASSLKRKTISLAAVLPRRDGNGEFYHKYFWDAISGFEAEAESLNVRIRFYSYDEDRDDQVAVLDAVFHASKPVDGLLTVPSRGGDDMQRAIERFSDRCIPVVLIDHDLPASGRICCVAPHDQLTGRLGAEILTAMVHKPGKILVVSGREDNASHKHNLQGFCEYLQEAGEGWEVDVIHSYGNYNKCYEQVCKTIQADSGIAGFYSVTARDTLPLAQAMADHGLTGTAKGVGSDLFPQSAELLRQNAVQALLYKNAYDKGRLGFSILFDYVVKRITPAAGQATVPISVIMKNNLPFFENRI